MSFDRRALEEAIAAHGRIARVVIAATRGSVPREAGAAMLVWEGGASGTIGGGALELDAMEAAREALRTGKDEMRAVPLGPGLGQCCGGHVTWVAEVWDAARLAGLGNVVARPLPGGDAEMPLSVKRRLARARSTGALPAPGITDGWLIEPVSQPVAGLWLYGAGHVGRAIAAVMAPLPDWSITWVDTAPDRFPDQIPEGVRLVPAPDPARATALAPDTAHHLILTYSHALDLALVAAVLSRPHASIGLIGSRTKWTRFRRRLLELGHPIEAIDRVRCPIGDPALGKHPHAIALGVARELLTLAQKKRPEHEVRAV